MAWKGFVEESKSYMNHPDYWKDGKAQLADVRRAKLKFWCRFPRAWVRFYRQAVGAWLKSWKDFH